MQHDSAITFQEVSVGGLLGGEDIFIRSLQKSKQIQINLVGNMSEPINENNILLLGMVYAHQAMEPKRGQEFRDRVRCEELEKNGYNIYTLDDKHDDSTIDEHCRANFADTRRMMQAIKTKWTGVNFQHVILDYFFSPVSYSTLSIHLV